MYILSGELSVMILSRFCCRFQVIRSVRKKSKTRVATTGKPTLLAFKVANRSATQANGVNNQHKFYCSESDSLLRFIVGSKHRLRALPEAGFAAQLPSLFKKFSSQINPRKIAIVDILVN
jgi:hypothetical protein